mgnify:CR=1 FL=1
MHGFASLHFEEKTVVILVLITWLGCFTQRPSDVKALLSDSFVSVWRVNDGAMFMFKIISVCALI